VGQLVRTSLIGQILFTFALLALGVLGHFVGQIVVFVFGRNLWLNSWLELGNFFFGDSPADFHRHENTKPHRLRYTTECRASQRKACTRFETLSRLPFNFDNPAAVYHLLIYYHIIMCM